MPEFSASGVLELYGRDVPELPCARIPRAQVFVMCSKLYVPEFHVTEFLKAVAIQIHQPAMTNATQIRARKIRARVNIGHMLKNRA